MSQICSLITLEVSLFHASSAVRCVSLLKRRTARRSSVLVVERAIVIPCSRVDRSSGRSLAAGFSGRLPKSESVDASSSGDRGSNGGIEDDVDDAGEAGGSGVAGSAGSAALGGPCGWVSSSAQGYRSGLTPIS